MNDDLFHDKGFVGKACQEFHFSTGKESIAGVFIDLYEEAPDGGAQQHIGRIGNARISRLDDTGPIQQYPDNRRDDGQNEQPQ